MVVPLLNSCSTAIVKSSKKSRLSLGSKVKKSNKPQNGQTTLQFANKTKFVDLCNYIAETKPDSGESRADVENVSEIDLVGSVTGNKANQKLFFSDDSVLKSENSCIDQNASDMNSNDDEQKKLSTNLLELSDMKSVSDDQALESASPSGSFKRKTSSSLLDSTPSKRTRKNIKEVRNEILRPCVAALENQGNTCFLNSALQVLRYTPGFVARVQCLASIIRSAKLSLQEPAIEKCLQDWELPREWDIVEELYATLRQMDASEVEFAQSGSNEDLLVIQPELLDVICVLNRQFEGHHQQDAHEFLQCVMCLVDEAWLRLLALHRRCPQLALLSTAQIPVEDQSTTTLKTETPTPKAFRRQSARKQLKFCGAKRTFKANGVSPALLKQGEDMPSIQKQESELPSIQLSRCDALLSGVGSVMLPSLQQPDVIGSLFKGRMCVCTRCSCCETERAQNEVFQELQVPVSTSELEEDSEEWPVRELKKHDKLGGEEKYSCDRCLSLQEAHRFMRFKQLPPRLILHIKRFAAIKGTLNGFAVKKITTYTPTPLQLPCLLDDCAGANCNRKQHRYNLYGIICHNGAALNAGHYVSYVRVSESMPRPEPGSEELASMVAAPGEWLECDDDAVRVLSAEELQHCVLEEGATFCGNTPYLLFYTRADQC